MEKQFPGKVLYVSNIQSMKDLASQVGNAIKKHGFTRGTIYINLVRQQINSWNLFTDLENLRDGFIQGGKYDGQECDFICEHLFVFTNGYPYWCGKCSSDRLIFYLIEPSNGDYRKIEQVLQDEKVDIYNEQRVEEIKNARIQHSLLRRIDPEDVDTHNKDHEYVGADGPGYRGVTIAASTGDVIADN